jgi:uncharacterized Zn finger protein (UPF0148 family)
MSTEECSFCSTVLTDDAKYCPSCGKPRKTKKTKSLFHSSEDELVQKTLRRMRNLEASLTEFNKKFDDVDIEFLIKNGAVTAFIEEASKIQEKLVKLQSQAKGIDVEQLIVDEFPKLVVAIREFNITVETMTEDLS